MCWYFFDPYLCLDTVDDLHVEREEHVSFIVADEHTVGAAVPDEGLLLVSRALFVPCPRGLERLIRVTVAEQLLFETFNQT